MTDLPSPRAPDEPDQPVPDRIESTFRSGSMTAVSVVIGFSLTFLNRWAALPGGWHVSDLAAVVGIVAGIVLQITTLARLLSPRSLLLRHYERSTAIFLAGLILVALGIGLAILGDVLGHGQRVLGG